jgi:hypothetical protein
LRRQADLIGRHTRLNTEAITMKPLMILSILTVLGLPVGAFAQATGAPNSGAAGRREPGGDNVSRDTLSQSDLKRLNEQIDQWKRVEGKGGVTPKAAKSRTAAMLEVLQVSCAVANAAYRGTGPDNAKENIYEAACEDGMGYLLVVQDSSLKGISCLMAETEGSPVKCALPGNSDGKAVAAAVLAGNNVSCKVRDFKSLGTSAANLDHVEVACEDGGAYVIRSPHPGAGGKLDVLGCQEAIKQGVPCELSPTARAASPPVADTRPTLSWFKEELSRNGVSCQTKRARIVGRESIKRRYLVEFECADRPEGLVAFVPAAGDTVNPFESMNCAVAAERGIRCELLPQ